MSTPSSTKKKFTIVQSDGCLKRPESLQLLHSPIRKQKKRLAEAERSLLTKVTKKATEDVRIAATAITRLAWNAFFF